MRAARAAIARRPQAATAACPVYRHFGACATPDCPHAHPPCRSWLSGRPHRPQPPLANRDEPGLLLPLPNAPSSLGSGASIALLDASQLVFYRRTTSGGGGGGSRRDPDAALRCDTLRGVHLLQGAIGALRRDNRFEHLVVVVDGSTKHRVSSAARALLEDLIHRRVVQESPVGVTADVVLLRLAQAYMAAGHHPSVVSNDAFREHDLGKHVPRTSIFVDAMDTIVVL